MQTLSWPAEIAPFRCAFYLQPHVGGAESPLTRTRKTYLLTRPRWVARLTFRVGYEDDEGPGSWAADLDALIVQLKGGANLIRFHDFRRPVRRGRPIGWPLTNEPAAKGATQMRIGGFPPFGHAYSVGDYVGGDGRAHLVLARSFADAAGVATITFEPPLATAVPAGAAIYSEVTCPFQLVNADDAGQNEAEVGQLVSYTLDFVEWLPDAS